VARSEPEALILVLAADSHVERPDAFRKAIDAAAAAAEARRLVMFGVKPTRPETGYGYIRVGPPLGDGLDAHRVDAFVEKPDRSTAEAYLSAGNYLWNSGSFMFRADTVLDELERLEPALVEACRRALAQARPDLDFMQLDRETFASAPVKSIDHAVMEHTDRAAVVPADFGWSDVGSWDTLWSISPKNPDANVLSGDVVVQDVHGSYLHANGRMVAAVGLKDIVLVETDDVVFVAPRERAADAKGLVETLKRSGRPEADNHSTVYRPWGSYRSIDLGDRFQVKRIIVKPGGRLSAQMHHHRAEHWVVVHGTAKVTIGDQTRLLHENESVYVPVGTLHRLENPGRLPLHLIEVQTGSYLGEDDIVRFDDDYGRRSKS
jgi:mannose-1-phosphate guanylyltransferase/mannose-6-phosphate isomerase